MLIRNKLIFASVALGLFVASVSLAWLWFGWKMAVVIVLGLMSVTLNSNAHR
jgi:hypothetical protein